MIDSSRKEKIINNESVLLSLKGNLDVDALQISINKVISSYEVMRRFISVGRECKKIFNQSMVNIHRVDMKDGLSHRKNDVIRKWLEEHNERNFDFINGLFIKISLIQLSKKENLLLVNGHHIITDVWFIDLFCTGLKEFYDSQIINRGIDLGESVQFEEYIKWKNEVTQYNNSEIIKKNSWKNELKNISNNIDSPLDYLKTNSSNARDDSYDYMYMNRTLDKTNNLRFDLIKEQLNLDLDFYGLQNKENIKYYILDYYMQKVPVDTIGNLYVGKNDIEKYNTNNLAMLNKDGELRIFGDKNKILDVQGRKVGLKIINDKIEVIPYINQNNKISRANELIKCLRECLPEYMMPKYFVKASALSISNKSDYKKLKPNNNDNLLNYGSCKRCEMGKNNNNMIMKIEEREYYPVVGMQKRLFIINQLNRKDVSYNFPIILTIEGIVDIVKLENSFKKIICRHEVFRTFFKLINGVPVQIINKRCDFKLNIVSAKSNNIDDIIKDFIIPFDLNQAPLLRANYIEIEEDRKILIIDMHHIISDGISVHIFAKELIDIYKGNDLNKIDVQYKDYIDWKNNNINYHSIKKSEKYWLEKIKDFTYTSLPKKYESDNKKNSGRNKEIYFNREEYLKIDMFCKKNLITKFTYFAAILNIILMNEIGENDISIGIPVSGRNNNKVQNLIGLFLNLVIIRINIDKNKTLKDYLHTVNEEIIGALSHQEYPYEELHSMAVERYRVKNESLFSVMLNYMPYIDDNNEEMIKVDGVTFKIHKEKYYNPKYDVTFYVKENKENILINMVYKNVFEENIMERIAKAFHNISEIVLNNSMITIKDIEYSEVMHEGQAINIMDDYFENEEFFIND